MGKVLTDSMVTFLTMEFKPETRIQRNQIITNDVIQQIKRIPGIKLSRLPSIFANVDEQNDNKWTVEVLCTSCSDHTFIKHLTKTTLLNYIKNKKKLLCSNCIDFKKGYTTFKKKQNIKIKKENALFFIQKYLDPKSYWKDNIHQKNRIEEIQVKAFYCDIHFIIDHINKKMIYKDFLKTPYWKAISQQVRFYAKYKCEKCNNSENLNVHHKTYENHGKEHLSHILKNDLICLCQKCHEKEHSNES